MKTSLLASEHVKKIIAAASQAVSQEEAQGDTAEYASYNYGRISITPAFGSEYFSHDCTFEEAFYIAHAMGLTFTD